jgi:hypothetical protein
MHMEQPPGFVQGDGRAKVYLVTKQASRLLFLLVCKTLLELGGGCAGQGGRVPLHLQIKGWFGVCAYTR